MRIQVTAEAIAKAAELLEGVACKTPLEFNKRLSKQYGADIYLKREDLQTVRSYKIRGAYNKMSLLDDKDRKRGIVCASAGNHSQGVALSASLLKTKSRIYMPQSTPRQKVTRVRDLGGSWVELIMCGDTFDEAYEAAQKYAKKGKKIFVHPFDDPQVIVGQGTVGVEIFEQMDKTIDYLVVPVGGGGLMAGLGTYAKAKQPRVKLIGVEPAGAPAMYESLKNKKITKLESIDKFVDGAAVTKPGRHTFRICLEIIDKMVLVAEGRVCQDMISLYQSEGIVAEPAGALAVSALDKIKDRIKGKTVVCVISGGNNDISRYPEIVERSLIWQGLKHYFIIEFAQRPGSLRSYLDNVLGKTDDITLFEYMKKSNRESGPALVGVELAQKSDLKPLLKRMDEAGMIYRHVRGDDILFRFLL